MSTKKNENESKPMPALMRKTKAQLVEIILRKDNIEKSLRNDIKDSEATLNNYKEKLVGANRQLDSKTYNYEKLKSNYEKLKSNYESMCDEYTSDICKLKENIKHKNFAIFMLSAGLIGAIFCVFYLCYL